MGRDGDVETGVVSVIGFVPYKHVDSLCAFILATAGRGSVSCDDSSF